MRLSRSMRKPPGPVTARRSTPSPPSVARSVVKGCARAPVASVAARRVGPAMASPPLAVSSAAISPCGNSMLCSSTDSRASSPGARKRGSSASATTASRTVMGFAAAPMRVPSQATAIRRNSPAKSGMSSGTMATPSAPARTTPENSETTRCGGCSASAPPASSPPWRSRASSPSAGGIRRP